MLAADEDIDVRRDLPAGGPTAAEAKKLETRGGNLHQVKIFLRFFTSSTILVIVRFTQVATWCLMVMAC